MLHLVKFYFKLLIIINLTTTCGNSSATQDQTSSRPNTLYDDADDIQKQLDNEARDRMKFGRPKTIWVFHLPTQFPEVNTETLLRNAKPRRTKLKRNRKSNSSAVGVNEWKYSDQNRWSTLYPDCGGRSQSPINLPTEGLISAKAGRQLLFRNYDTVPESLTLQDDGKRLILFGSWRRNQRPLIYGGAANSRRYLFHSLILHWPSEHSIHGVEYPMESQVIHVSAEYDSLSDAIEASSRDPLAILGVANIYKFGNKTQPGLEELLKTSKNIGFRDKSITRRSLSAFSPPFSEYVAYHGSLTVPPCTESVLWMVRARSLTLKKDAGIFAQSIIAPGGKRRSSLLRKRQPINDRKIYFFS